MLYSECTSCRNQAPATDTQSDKGESYQTVDAGGGWRTPADCLGNQLATLRTSTLAGESSQIVLTFDAEKVVVNHGCAPQCSPGKGQKGPPCRTFLLSLQLSRSPHDPPRPRASRRYLESPCPLKSAPQPRFDIQADIKRAPLPPTPPVRWAIRPMPFRMPYPYDTITPEVNHDLQGQSQRRRGRA